LSAHSPTADKANSARAIEKMPRHAYREIRYSCHKCTRFRFVIRSADKETVKPHFMPHGSSYQFTGDLSKLQ
jgi:hypothetical protein